MSNHEIVFYLIFFTVKYILVFVSSQIIKFGLTYFKLKKTFIQFNSLFIQVSIMPTTCRSNKSYKHLHYGGNTISTLSMHDKIERQKIQLSGKSQSARAAEIARHKG